MEQAGRRRVDIAVDLPQTHGDDPIDALALRDLAILGEELGYRGLWLSEDVLGESGTSDPLITLAHVAAVTSRVELGVAVLLAPLHGPVPLAKATATLDQLSDGRLVVGLGLGGDRSTYPAFGVPAEGRAARFDHVAGALRALWMGEEPEDPTPAFDLRGRIVRPRPRRRPHPPLWFGGHARGALERAVRLGDGFVGGGSSTSESFARSVTTVRELLGDEPERDFTIAKRVYVGCDDLVPGAGDRLRRWIERRYGGRVSPDVAVTGDLEDCVEGLDQLVRAGADQLILSFVEGHEQHYRAAARDLLPALDHA